MLTMPILAAAGPGAGAGVPDAPWARAREEMAILNPRVRGRVLIFDMTRIAFRAPSDSYAQGFCALCFCQGGLPGPPQIPYGLAGAAGPAGLLAAEPLPAGLAAGAAGL